MTKPSNKYVHKSILTFYRSIKKIAAEVIDELIKLSQEIQQMDKELARWVYRNLNEN